MRRCPEYKIVVRPEFCVTAALLLFILPLQWAAAWAIASAIHEAGHFAALRSCGVEVYSVSIGIDGAVMETAPMSVKKELLCALAGPLAGAALVAAGKQYPCVAICAIAQTAFNLLPLFPLDGGRALKCLLLLVFQAERVCTILQIVAIILFAVLLVLAVLCLLVFELGPMPLCCTVLLAAKYGPRKISCKQGKQIVQ